MALDIRLYSHMAIWLYGYKPIGLRNKQSEWAVEWTTVREGSGYQIGSIFGKVPKGGRWEGGGFIFNPKIYIANFGNFKQGFLSTKLIKRGVISGFRVCFLNNCININ